MSQPSFRRRLFLAAAASLALAASSVSAAVLITVDVSNPAAVTFTSTGAAADVEDSATDTYSGATLLEFFLEEVFVADSIVGTLTPAGASVAYDEFFVDMASGFEWDLNFYQFTADPEQQLFTTTAPAFTGSTTMDLSAFEDQLPLPGMTRDILAGWSDDPGSIIGQWTVVPEVTPAAQVVVLGLCLMGWLACRRGGVLAKLD